MYIALIITYDITYKNLDKKENFVLVEGRDTHAIGTTRTSS